MTRKRLSSRALPVTIAFLALACGGEAGPSAASPSAQRCPRPRPPSGSANTAIESGPPPTAAHDVTDTYHGVAVVDRYRWLEKDDQAVAEWSAAQNAHARSNLDALPERPPVRARIAELLESQSPDYFDLAERRGTLFALEFHPPKQQSFLVTLALADVLGGKNDAPSERVLLDPNVLDASGGTTIDFFVPSLDGKKVAVSLSKGGSERGDVHFYDVATGKELGDVVPHVNGGTAGGSLAWNADGSGAWYTRYPRDGERPAADLDSYQQVWFHKLRTPPSADTYAVGKDAPRIAEFKLETSEDGRFVLATAANGDGGEFEHWLRGLAGSWTKVTEFSDKIVDAAIGRDGYLYLLSRKDAAKGKVLRVWLAKPTLAKAEVIVPESDTAVVQGIAPERSKLYVVDLLGGPSQIRTFSLAKGAKAEPATLQILQTSAVNEIVRLSGDDMLFRNQSFVEPPGWYRYDAKAAAVTPTLLHETSKADFHDSEVVREQCTSKDGTKVPLSILRRRGAKLDGTNPTLLYAYGGYGRSQVPKFRPVVRVWLEAGGVYAVANIRGGGELGEAWHEAGKLTHKQNVFDDFAACAKTLFELGYSRPARLAILGGSNGGLLMGAELTQHPEMFRAVVSRVGIYDMLRVELTPNGSFNTTEYGSVKDPEQFQALYGYSPYHHVKDGVAYPAVLMMTGAHDPRVDPWQSRKMVARLQAATSSKEPVLLRTNGDTGHGLSTPLAEEIEEQADIYGFIAHEVGAKPGSLAK